MVIRMLGPAAPISATRSAAVRASLRLPRGPTVRTTWEWDDGEIDRAEHEWAALVHARLAHRYAAAGVYRVRVQVDGSSTAPIRGMRYVVVRHPMQLAASGWIRAPDAAPAPFGFLITPGSEGTGADVQVRCLVDAGELVGRGTAWMMATGSGTLHFGGEASIGERGGHPYRVDASFVRAAGAPQHASLSVYAPGGVPGRDAPIERISGPIRPGRVVLAAPEGRP